MPQQISVSGVALLSAWRVPRASQMSTAMMPHQMKPSALCQLTHGCAAEQAQRLAVEQVQDSEAIRIYTAPGQTLQTSTGCGTAGCHSTALSPVLDPGITSPQQTHLSGACLPREWVLSEGAVMISHDAPRCFGSMHDCGLPAWPAAHACGLQEPHLIPLPASETL